MSAQEEQGFPLQQPGSAEEHLRQRQEQQHLVTSLRDEATASHDPALAQQADALQSQYHANDMAQLAADVYDSAAHQPPPPGLGYIRASEHPEMLRAMGVDWSDEKIHDMLQPGKSDFRAEIYIPDPAVLGPDAKPVIAFKGSNGTVYGDDGKPRESALSDWISNARQAQGLESDHYTRAMDLASAFKSSFKGIFEIDGHSKGGGQALAAAAVTGMEVYTFNAASLHRNTALFYAQKHNLQTFDVNSLSHGYYVKGEVLHDGLNLMRDMDGISQSTIAGTFRNFSEVSEVPEAQEILDQQVKSLLPYDKTMQSEAIDLIDTLAEKASANTLKDIPPHAGLDHLVELAPKSRDGHGGFVDRPAVPTLAQDARTIAPIIGAVAIASEGAVIGKHVGDAVATAGRTAEDIAQFAGSTARQGWEISGKVVHAGSEQAGKIVDAEVRYGGEIVAGARLAGGHIESWGDQGLAWGSSLTNSLRSGILRGASSLTGDDSLRREAERGDRAAAAYAAHKNADARDAIRDAREDARDVRQFAAQTGDTLQHGFADAGKAVEHGAQLAGQAVDGSYRWIGGNVRDVTSHAPAAGTGAGFLAGSGFALRATGSAIAVGLGIEKLKGNPSFIQSGKEAVARHGMADVTIPSMDAHTREMEQQAIQRMDHLKAAHEHSAMHSPIQDSHAAIQLDDPSHACYALFKDASRGVNAHDCRVGRTPNIQSHQLAAGLAAEMHAAGGTRIDQVAMSADASRTFGVQGRQDDPAQLRVSVDTMTAMNTPLSESSQRVAEADAARSQQQVNDQQLEQSKNVSRVA